MTNLLNFIKYFLSGRNGQVRAFLILCLISFQKKQKQKQKNVVFNLSPILSRDVLANVMDGILRIY